MNGCYGFSIGLVALLLMIGHPASISAETVGAPESLDVEITKKGLGKEVSLRQGTKEWYMLVEVTPDNTVVIRQEKDQDTYLVDESETHDRALSPGEVDAVIQAFIDSVKTQDKAKRN